MSFLSDIHTYWANSTALNAALPASKVYTGGVPENMTMPYGVIVNIGSKPTWLTQGPTPGAGAPYFETFTFQISIYDTDPDNVETIAQVVMDEFDFKPITTETIYCQRMDSRFVSDDNTPAKIFHMAITYDFAVNKTLPA